MRPLKPLGAILLAGTLGACASAHYPATKAAPDAASEYDAGSEAAESPPENEDPNQALRDAMEAFDRILLSASPQDCADAEALLQTICGLAKRICRLAEDTPTDVAAKDRCTDAALRCDRARERYADECE